MQCQFTASGQSIISLHHRWISQQLRGQGVNMLQKHLTIPNDDHCKGVRGGVSFSMSINVPHAHALAIIFTWQRLVLGEFT